MNDDWRLRTDLRDPEQARELTELLRSHEVESNLEHAFHDRVVVSFDGPGVFCYAGTREQAQQAEQVVKALAAEHGWEPEMELTHWHPTSEQWEDPDEPLPESSAELDRERLERVAQERKDSMAQGYPEFEVRVQCATRADAAALADTLQQERIPIVHRWSYVLVGALDEDSAAALAERLRAEAPTGSAVTVEGNLRAVYNERPWRPFSVLGGLAG